MTARFHIPLGFKRKLLPAATALIIFFFPFVSSATAAQVIVVKDAEIKPYRDAIEGFKSSCNCSVKELDIDELDAVEEAIKSRPSAVFVVGTRAFRKIKAIQNIPVIYAMVMPSETADSRGNNVWGVRMDIAPEIYLESISSLFPAAKRIGVLFDPGHTGPFVRQAAALSAGKGVTLISKTINDPREAPALLEQMLGKIDVLWMLPDATVVNPETIDYLMLYSFRNNIPLFSFSEKYVEKGAVAALRIDPRDMGIQAGEMAREAFDSTKKPVRAYARNSRLVVNTKIGTKMGVRINGELVRNAEKVE